MKVIKNLLNVSFLALYKGTVFGKNAAFFAKNADYSKIKRVLVVYGVFSETSYILTYQTSRF